MTKPTKPTKPAVTKPAAKPPGPSPKREATIIADAIDYMADQLSTTVYDASKRPGTANVVDGLFEIAASIRSLADAIKGEQPWPEGELVVSSPERYRALYRDARGTVEAVLECEVGFIPPPLITFHTQAHGFVTFTFRGDVPDPEAEP